MSDPQMWTLIGVLAGLMLGMQRLTVREMVARFDAVDKRFESMESRLDARTDALEAKLDARADALEAKLDARTDALEAKFGARTDSLEERIDARFDSSERLIEARFLDVDHRFASLEADVRIIKTSLLTQKSA